MSVCKVDCQTHSWEEKKKGEMKENSIRFAVLKAKCPDSEISYMYKQHITTKLLYNFLQYLPGDLTMQHLAQ